MFAFPALSTDNTDYSLFKAFTQLGGSAKQTAREKLRGECCAEKRSSFTSHHNPSLLVSARMEQAATGASWLQCIIDSFFLALVAR